MRPRSSPHILELLTPSRRHFSRGFIRAGRGCPWPIFSHISQQCPPHFGSPLQPGGADKRNTRAHQPTANHTARIPSTPTIPLSRALLTPAATLISVQTVLGVPMGRQNQHPNSIKQKKILPLRCSARGNTPSRCGKYGSVYGKGSSIAGDWACC